jgi:hypothetical protein
MTADAATRDGGEQTLSLAEAARLRVIDAGAVKFSKAGARLDMTLEGDTTYEKVTIRRAFPLTVPTGYHSVRGADNKEIGMLCGIEKLDAESRRLLDLELARRYMVAIVRKIVKVTERFGTVDWHVETDRGPCCFTTRDLRATVIRVGTSHYLLSDVENNRFEVPDLDALDPNSQALLIRHL